MNHSLISSTAVAVAAVASPPISHKHIVNAAPTVSNYHKIVSSQSDQPQDCRQLVHRRRATTLGLAGLALGFISSDDRRANAAGRRAPPPPPEEKKDPSMNAVTAKVLASKKRKEAMKESIARLKEKGKVITDQPSQ